jgi:putative transcriptional regulator
MAGLDDDLAVRHGLPPIEGGIAAQSPSQDVLAARKRLGLSQSGFSVVFGVSVATVRDWEKRRRQPTGAAKVLLTLIEKNPDVVVAALHLLQHHTNDGG